MKKLFILLTITLLSVSAFSQLKPTIGSGGVADYFSKVPAYQMYDVYKKDGEVSNTFLASTLSFVANGNIFLVSYDVRPQNLNSISWNDGEKRTRELYLYRLDSDGWKIAIDKSLHTDYKQDVGNPNIKQCEYYLPCLKTKDNEFGGEIIINDDGSVIIYLMIMYNEVKNLSETKYATESIFLTPVGNNTYQINAKGSPVYPNNRQ